MIDGDPNLYRQSSDKFKAEIISPHLADLVLNNLGTNKNIKIVDFGSGDSLALSHLIDNLDNKEVRVTDLLLLETDPTILPHLLNTASQREGISTIIANYQDNHGFDLLPEPSVYESQYDIALAQMVFHQIESDALLSLMLFRLSQALTNSGTLFVVDLNPHYIDHLVRAGSPKYEKIDGRKGDYVFSNGIKVPYINRSMEEILGLCIGVGLSENPKVHEIGVNKPRSLHTFTLLSQGFPIGNILEVHKPGKSKTSFFEGTLDKVKQISYNLFNVSFANGCEYQIPLPGATKNAKQGDFIVVSETQLPDGVNYLNVWLTNDKEVKHGQGKIYLNN